MTKEVYAVIIVAKKSHWNPYPSSSDSIKILPAFYEDEAQNPTLKRFVTIKTYLNLLKIEKTHLEKKNGK